MIKFYKINLITLFAVTFTIELCVAQGSAAEVIVAEYDIVVNGEYTDSRLYMSGDKSVFLWYQVEQNERDSEGFDMDDPLSINIRFDEGMFVCNDRSTDRMLSSESTYRNRYIVHDQLPDDDWNISDQSETIFGFNAIKAEFNFRGRLYTAWFTPDISQSFGPWKLGGLPGLILKVEEDSGAFLAEITNINQTSLEEMPSETCEITESISYDEYRIKYKSDMDDFLQLIQYQSGDGLIFNVGDRFVLEKTILDDSY